jgi:hypothetical protein
MQALTIQSGAAADFARGCGIWLSRDWIFWMAGVGEDAVHDWDILKLCFVSWTIL